MAYHMTHWKNDEPAATAAATFITRLVVPTPAHHANKQTPAAAKRDSSNELSRTKKRVVTLAPKRGEGERDNSLARLSTRELSRTPFWPVCVGVAIRVRHLSCHAPRLASSSDHLAFPALDSHRMSVEARCREDGHPMS
jgi:hypothetical protein